jgi:hypothetical protein
MKNLQDCKTYADLTQVQVRYTQGKPARPGVGEKAKCGVSIKFLLDVVHNGCGA